jgi:two-component system, cell cycle response regulator DivK
MNARAALKTTQRRTRPPLVLVVDDFPDARDLYAEVLELAGFRVEQADNGAAAVERARQLHPSVIVMDLSLPILDGWEATRILKSDPSTCTQRIVAISAHSLDSHIARALDAGADAFLSKPCLPDELVSAVRHLLEQRVSRNGTA